MTMTVYRWAAAAVAAVAVLVAGGCSRAIPGTPVATPGEGGRSVAVGELLSTTCRQFMGLKNPERQDVITAIAEDGNEIIAMNPEVWVGVATALCTFADPSAPVRDVITGGIR